MHQYKTVAQILLILSIFNLVFAAPIIREIRYAHSNELAPVTVRNAAMPKERSEPGSDGTPSNSSPSPPDGPPGEMASDQPHYTQVTHDMVENDPPRPESKLKKFAPLAGLVAVDAAVLAVTGGLLWHYRHKLRRRTIDLDWYVSNPSHPSCKRLESQTPELMRYSSVQQLTDLGTRA